MAVVVPMNRTYIGKRLNNNVSLVYRQSIHLKFMLHFQATL
jgi:hypothetical protein